MTDVLFLRKEEAFMGRVPPIKEEEGHPECNSVLKNRLGVGRAGRSQHAAP